MKSLPWLAANLPGYLRFRRALGEPETIQRSLLLRYLKGNADTAFGRAHGFASLRTAEEYRGRVPLLAGEDLAPWVDRIAAGEADVLTRSPVRVLEPTSGSSAAAKLIPYTVELQREIRRAVAPWIVDLSAAGRGLRSGPPTGRSRRSRSTTSGPRDPCAWGSKRTSSTSAGSGAASSMRRSRCRARCGTCGTRTRSATPLCGTS